MRSVPAQRKAPIRNRSSSRTTKNKVNSGAGKKKLINRGTQKYFSQMALGGLIFFSAFIFLAGYSIYKYLNQAFASASSADSYAISDSSIVTLSFIEVENVNADPVILKGLKYIVFDKNDEKVSVFDIPLDIKVDMTGKFGEEEISKVFALGALNSTNVTVDGIKSVNNTIMRIFGFSIDRYILVNEDLAETLLNSFSGKGLSEILNLQVASDLKKFTISNLTISEYYSLVNFSGGLAKDKIAMYSITQEDINDSGNLDSQIADMNFDGDISREELSVAILNGTDYPGVAMFGSRLVTNSGGRVVAVSNAASRYETSYIATDIRDSATLSYLSRVLGIRNIISKQEAQKFNENEVDRSEITVIVGFDTADSLY
ncbi:MAG: hypothetical protein UU64_C0003G0015 [candidate division WWE3 bacterium GW2011_GWF2_41_45]|uniref:LytR/CpsA/Psr regulator C-terminal domain-containing protein n=2 Tax=Katanobacteria TaxID=422282 RepID=A0A1F4W246_UNCKA|nr:MAG: hypothetical protein UU55_C0003G0046 [candidate division WWE3 bacterium GW2011_GWC2_41_23]KKS10506.1 MAG: hypothetical protein UU64_C0003G0015 [candidate division WWE3 bacterium GW2011_GWF2_41_45]KKS20299.1 MAG: hypothetical protein UU79_C0002G0065 [candidate division WWE3 bacterium GW2011_GWE1_41_72]KKS28458.1 MAG: hypothetical protein UU90_C0027G0007 [candidate division WWE3 bacterium GW2011_GWD2_42_11]KKS51055.1 MAG: hypothetical protein UV16_C0003G0065 [candidate division WWE3 bacte